MKRPVFYIHGYGSSGNSETVVNLRRMLDDEFELIAPTYSGSAPLEAAKELETLYAKHAGANPIIVGTSLGGFFANYLSRVTNAPSVIVNPSIRPSASLNKYGEPAEVLAGYAELEAFEAQQTNKSNRIIVLGLLDDVVDPATNGLKLAGETTVVMLRMGHRIEPAFYGTIASLVRKLALD